MDANISLIIVVVLFVVALAIIGYYILKMTKEFTLNEQKKTLLEIQKIGESETRKVVTPVQLQAYERLVLFLERMKPDNLVLRCYQPGMETRLLRDVMIQNIRDEYEHNLSQQLYISSQAWVYIKNAKEDIINNLNAITPKEGENCTPTAFAGQLFENMSGKQTQIELAQDFLKNEIQERFK
ncbi:MAG: hypothetical protein KBT03_13570 [Bacteroidales bacterium]|nr:hypothetical protein [Candidatus Scybalousia scybalohippi]MCQ2327213.1 hypothetical protein [Bacteroidales bacterium]